LTLAPDKVTVNVSVLGMRPDPCSVSIMVATSGPLALPIETVGSPSSSMMVPGAVATTIVALAGLLRSTVRCSLFSPKELSSVVWTVTVWLVTPGAKTKSPLVAT